MSENKLILKSENEMGVMNINFNWSWILMLVAGICFVIVAISKITNIPSLNLELGVISLILTAIWYELRKV